MSILVNAKDALIKNNTQNPYIQISAIKTQNTISIHIQDNGGGITVQPIEKIFEPYITAKSDGTGLGLYIAAILAKKNNIALSCKNATDRAEFILQIQEKSVKD